MDCAEKFDRLQSLEDHKLKAHSLFTCSDEIDGHRHMLSHLESGLHQSEAKEMKVVELIEIE